MLSDRQLADIGISRVLLRQGYSAYPWREETVAQIIPDNVSQLNATNTANVINETQVMPRAPKAA